MKEAVTNRFLQLFYPFNKEPHLFIQFIFRRRHCHETHYLSFLYSKEFSDSFSLLVRIFTEVGTHLPSLEIQQADIHNMEVKLIDVRATVCLEPEPEFPLLGITFKFFIQISNIQRSSHRHFHFKFHHFPPPTWLLGSNRWGLAFST